MPLNIWFWIIYFIAGLFFWWISYDGQPAWYRRAGALTVLWILVGILGLSVFGSAVK
jgi:hypothetical protein